MDKVFDGYRKNVALINKLLANDGTATEEQLRQRFIDHGFSPETAMHYIKNGLN
jgi:hypothetical protein